MEISEDLLGISSNCQYAFVFIRKIEDFGRPSGISTKWQSFVGISKKKGFGRTAGKQAKMSIRVRFYTQQRILLKTRAEATPLETYPSF